MIRFRFHRGGLKESMETATTIKNYECLSQYIYEETGFSDISFEYAKYDERIDWDTWYVCFNRYHEFKSKGVIGMADAALVPLKGEVKSNFVWMYNNLLCPISSQFVHNHSPDGFSWGYSGSGPAQLALAICMKLYSNPIPYYMKFKDKYIATLPEGDFETELSIRHEHNTLNS